MKKINRPFYLEQLINKKENGKIKVITGIRRSGKTTIIDLFREWLINKNYVKESQIIYIDFGISDYDGLLECRRLEDYIGKKIIDACTNYVFIDEVQNCEKFEKALISILKKHKTVDIYITGSNSKLLSKQIIFKLRGYEDQISMMPLSFKEYLSFMNVDRKNATNSDLTKYINTGGFPDVVLSKDRYGVESALNSIRDNIVTRDVIENAKSQGIILREDNLITIVQYIFDQTGSPYSRLKLLQHVNKGKMKTKRLSAETIDEYIKALENAYIIKEVNSRAVGKQRADAIVKYYNVDVGLKKHICNGNFNISGDIENIVYSELLRRGESVFIGRYKKYESSDGEIDFVTEDVKTNKMTFIQVSVDISEKETRKREFSAFEHITYKGDKLIITYEDYLGTIPEEYTGIEVITLFNWLLK